MNTKINLSIKNSFNYKKQKMVLSSKPALDNVSSDESVLPIHGSPPERKLGPIALIAVIFFTVSGGAYGLEPLVGAVGPGWALLLVLLTPLFWSLPIACMVAELTSAIPEEGGYYIWVSKGLGEFWGVMQGWLMICYSLVDMAIYPVLFVNYLSYLFPSLALDANGLASRETFLSRWLIAILVIAAALAVNWRGARAVGRTAVFNTVLVLLPFVLISTMGLSQDGSPGKVFSIAANNLGQTHNAGLIALGLSTVLWNYCGWDNASTFAGEVHAPQRNYILALACALPLITAAYLLPLLAGIAVTIDPALWNESQGWPVIAGMIGGHWLGTAVATVALLSAYSLFASQLLYTSRLPYVMAREGWLPALLGNTSKRTGIPFMALLASCAVSAVFVALPFNKLVILDILLYVSSLSLQFMALMALRRKEPDMKRPFRIPGGLISLSLVMFAPICLAGIVLVTSLAGEGSDYRQIVILCAVIASGIIIYLIRRKDVRGARIHS